MRNATEPQLYYPRAGHCTRCEAAFADEAVRYMVRQERVVWRRIGPVCAACLRGDKPGGQCRETVCGGCGATISPTFTRS